MPTIDNLKQIRLQKLEKLNKQNISAFPAWNHSGASINAARNEEGKELLVAGRIRGKRGHGKIQFMDLVDESGKIQIVVKADQVNKETLELLHLLDTGDFINVIGTIGKTQSGEISIFAKNIMLLTKSLRPLPDDWYGLKDIEERYRQRYTDLLMNPDVRKVFDVRTKVIKLLRKKLDETGFVEVETPILQPLYGGASAQPFTTHHNALDMNLYLRIAVELYLKRLIVGGYEKVYEIGKDFRNEGMDRGHNPEFTMLEFYWAYADYEKLMQFSEDMISEIVKEIHESMKFTYKDIELDFTPPWKRIRYRDAVFEHTSIDIDINDTEESLRSAIKEKNIVLTDKHTVGYGALLDALYKQTTRPHLIGPLFLTERPTAFVSLAKRLPHDPRKTASFQLLVVGEEFINAYNELNDPIDQALRWRESEELGKKGHSDHEAFDYDYIRALEYGMPPTAGWGMGVDRLVAVLTNQQTIKDVILFPTMRPEEFDDKKSSKDSYDYKERKIVGIINSELSSEKALNALGHLMFSLGYRSDESWMGQKEIRDRSGSIHAGISKYPVIILEATTDEIRNIRTYAMEQKTITMIDYPEEMFETAHDSDLVNAIGKKNEVDLIYHALSLSGTKKEIDALTKGLKLYNK